jgi:hypothetical protein
MAFSGSCLCFRQSTGAADCSHIPHFLCDTHIFDRRFGRAGFLGAATEAIIVSRDYMHRRWLYGPGTVGHLALYREKYIMNLSQGFVIGDVTLLNVPPLFPHAFHPLALAR